MEATCISIADQDRTSARDSWFGVIVTRIRPGNRSAISARCVIRITFSKTSPMRSNFWTKSSREISVSREPRSPSSMNSVFMRPNVRPICGIEASSRAMANRRAALICVFSPPLNSATSCHCPSTPWTRMRIPWPRPRLLQSRRLSFNEVPSLSLGIEFFLESLDLRLCRAKCLFGRSKPADFCCERRPSRFEGRTLRREVREPCAHVADLPQQDREFVDPLPFPGLFEDGRADDFQAFLVLLRVWDGIELAQRLDLRIVEGLEEPMAIVGLPSEFVLQLLELPLVFRQHERVLIDRGDLFVDPREGLLRPRLFLTQFPDQVGAVREPFQFPRDPRHAFFQSPFVSEGTERGLPVDVRPERGDLSVQLVDPILRLVASLFVLALREVELPPRRSGRGLPLPVGRLRILEPVHLIPQPIEVLDFVLEGGPFRLEPRGDLTLVSDLRLAGLEGFQPVRPILEGRRRPHPSLVLRLEILHFAGAGFEGGLELGDARSALCAVLVQAFQLFLESGEAAERFFPRGDLGLLGLDVALHRRQSFLRSLEGLFEDLKTKELLEHRESLRPAGGPQLLHLLLADEGRVPESVVVETYDVADRPLFVRDRSLDRLAVARELEVRFLLRREAARDFPALVPLPERHTDVTVRPTHVRELHALNVRPRRLAVQGEGDRVQDRRL